MVLLIVALFLLALWLRRRWPGIENHHRPVWLLLPAAVVTGYVTEFGAWADAYIADEKGPALFHPQLGWDWFLATGFYLGWGIGWLLLMRRHAFSLWEIVAIQGFIGVAIEQDGAVLITGLGTMPLGLILWAFVAAIYGSSIGLAALVCGRPTPKRTDANRWWRSLLALVVVTAATYLTMGAWLGLLEVLGIDAPAAKPIRAHPFT